MDCDKAKACEMIERLKGDPAEAVRCVDEWSSRLEAAIASPANGLGLCENGRYLTYAAILASSRIHKDLWTEERVRRALSLLVRAIPAAKNTGFYANCVDRPREFADNLSVAYEGNPEAESMLARVLKEYETAIQHGMPAVGAC